MARTSPGARWKPFAIGGGITAAAAACVVGALLSIPSVSAAEAGTGGDYEELPAVSKPAELGAPRDPLSGEEISYAIAVALGDDSIPADATQADGSEGPQVLSVDVASTDVDAPERRATVLVYDYTGDRVYSQTVDLATGEVDSVSATGVQPPTSVPEVDRAFELLLADETAGGAVKAEFARLTGAELTNADQVAVTGGAFGATAGVVGAEQCGTDRCVQMQIKVPHGPYLDTTAFVVDLSTSSVITIK